VKVAQAGPGDFAPFAALVREYLASIDLPPELRDEDAQLRAYLQPPDAAWLAFVDDAPLGTIALRPLPERGNACEVKRLYVRPAGRGLGIAHHLLDALETYARAQGFAWAYLDTRADLTAAIAFYRRRGYEPCERYNDNPVASFFFRRALSPPTTRRRRSP